MLTFLRDNSHERPDCTHVIIYERPASYYKNVVAVRADDDDAVIIAKRYVEDGEVAKVALFKRMDIGDLNGDDSGN